jgi:hypothetical protein
MKSSVITCNCLISLHFTQINYLHLKALGSIVSTQQARFHTHVILEDYLIEILTSIDIADINFKYKQLPHMEALNIVHAFLNINVMG